MAKFLQRKSLRLKEYDYSRVGHYFITICTKDKISILGEIVEDEDPVFSQAVMKQNKIGQIVSECWNSINDVYSSAKTDAFCLMPNHIHGIIVISGSDQDRPSLPQIIQGYKSVTTRKCFKYNLKTIWQRNYYEHVIRNEKEYLEICAYIANNPLKWAEDEYYR